MSAVCRVCGTDIVEAPRLCPKCDTPHHSDCWAYTGRCSVYGCGGGEVKVSAVAEAPAGAAVSLAADVPVAGSARSADVWHADENGAWIGRPDPAITVLPGERIVMLPPAVARRLPGEDSQPAAIGITTAALLVCGLAAVALGSTGAGVCLITGTLGAVALAGKAGVFTAPAPDLAWIARGAGGLRLCTLWQGKLREESLAPHLAPSAVTLSRSYQDAADGSGGTLMTYELSLVLPPERTERPQPVFIPLAPPLQMPDRAAERRPLLEHLVARRTLGHHVADLLRLQFDEGASR
jgi:hypothetical protein